MTKRDIIFVALLWLVAAWPTEVPTRPDLVEVATTYQSIAVSRGDEDVEYAIARHGKIASSVLIETTRGRRAKVFPGPTWLGGLALKVAGVVAEPKTWDLAVTLRFLRLWVFLPFSLLGFVALRRIIRDLGLDENAQNLGSLLWFMGTTVLQLSSAVLGVELVSVFLLCAIALVLTTELRLFRSANASITLPMIGAGTLVSAILASDIAGIGYAAAVFVFLLAGPLRRRPGGLAQFTISALPGLGVWVLSVQKFYDFGNLIPILGATSKVSDAFFASSGLLVLTPLFALSATGLFVFARQGRTRLIITIAVAMATAIAGMMTPLYVSLLGFAQAGLIPALGLLALSTTAGIDAIRGKLFTDGIVYGLFASSTIAQAVMWAFSPNVPRSGGNVLADEIPLMLGEGLVPTNLGVDVLGLQGLVSLSVYAVAVFALVLVPIVIGQRAGSRSHGASLVLALIVGSVHLGLISNFGGRWSAAERRQVKTAIERINGHNASFKRKALDAVQIIDGMDK